MEVTILRSRILVLSMYIFISIYLPTYIHISTTREYYPAIKESEIMSFTATMDVPRDYHTKQSKAEKDK